MDLRTRRRFAALSILVVDDQIVVRQIVTTICQKLGCEQIDVASDGVEAVQMVQDKLYAVVIADWNMQPVTGIQLLRAVRTDPRLSGTKFLLMTARQDAASVVHAKKAGVDAYIVKPFSPAALQEKLLTVLA
ncbi:response regulator [Methylobacterium oryzisoli]|uniref:response regulator n=1 Tax=Methylobacterium oryzisoli TaxID=3385502 RepID=UPI0038921B32